MLRRGRRRRRRHVLELEGHDVDAAGERADPRRDRRTTPRPRRRRSGRWACRARARACGRGSRGAAPPSRTCGPAGRRRARRSSSREEWERARASRQRVAADRRRRSRRGRPAAARAARAATSRESRPPAGRRWPRPAAPIATVATGTPFGIWTIDSSESSPFSAALCTGTPITGSTVCAATMPGRCAAPPAPAMITSRPRSAAVVAYSAIQRRRAMRRHDPALVRDVEPGQHLVGLPHRVPVGLAAHDDADERPRLRHADISSQSGAVAATRLVSRPTRASRVSVSAVSDSRSRIGV